MEIDTLITDLNIIITSQGKGVDKIDKEDLTVAEEQFLNEYEPQKSIIIYGTLAPNRPNHSKIEHINGKWIKGVVKGKLVKEGWGAELGYYGFKHSSINEQESIEAFILFSDELVNNWTYLDKFEGDGYRRILAKFELENGEVGVGNIYAINDIKL
ncbi:gamma-glutamylcyclotransferase [Flavobacterium sp. Sr18]|uniref:gamma-glutamylcyclotransferase n=1 Tax=Flavobacterium sp. Sr18 TaxID=935222 RepID=UPI001F49887E|nr:gamma-glutamylcyclotransferase [Flavobacterium sp. Sr18]